MKIDGDISILVGAEKTTIELRDKTSNITFAIVTLTPEQLSMALSRLAHTPCQIEARALERVGKVHEHKKFEFPLPEDALRYEIRGERAGEIANRLCPDGWKADNYFKAQDSFFKRDGKTWARTTIRRWVGRKEDGDNAGK